MDQEMGLFEAMDTQRAIRRFKPDPVPHHLLRRVLQAAGRAPSGGNRQPWHFVVVDDRGLRKRLGEIYRASWYSRFYNPDGTPREGSTSRVFRSAKYLADHLEEAPVLVFACLDRGGAGAPAPEGVAPLSVASRYASLYPAVQNLLLAARGLGLGTTLTTALTHTDHEIKALLGIPREMELCAAIPMGWPAEGASFGPTTRKPLEEVTHYNGWGKQLPPSD